MNEDTNSIIREYLVNQPTLTAEVGTRIYCPRLPENTILPAISFFTRGGISTPYIPGIINPSVQFDCWGNDPIEARQVYRALYDNLQGIQNQLVTSIVPTLWISPTSHNDPHAEWDNEGNAYDDDIITFATCNNVGREIELTVESLHCSQLRYYLVLEGRVSQIDLDALYNGIWHDVFEGVPTEGVWESKSLGGIYLVTKARIRGAGGMLGTDKIYLYEFDFESIPCILSAIEEVQGQDLVDVEIPDYFRVLTFFNVMIKAD